MKVYWWEYAILIIAILYVVLMFCMYFNAPSIENYITDSKEIEWTSYENFLEKADNGDLILLSGDSKGERTCRWAVGCVFSHVGIIFREKEDSVDKLYIWEADIGQKSKAGPRIIRLEDKLERYKGFRVAGWTPLKGSRPSTKDILNLVPKYVHKKLDNWMLIWLLPNWSIFNGMKKDRKTVFCGELIADSLQDLGILDRTRPAANYSPRDFHIDSNNSKPKELFPKYEYTKTIFINF